VHLCPHWQAPSPDREANAAVACSPSHRLGFGAAIAQYMAGCQGPPSLPRRGLRPFLCAAMTVET
jgi:hypothetical protein